MVDWCYAYLTGISFSTSTYFHEFSVSHVGTMAQKAQMTFFAYMQIKWLVQFQLFFWLCAQNKQVNQKNTSEKTLVVFIIPVLSGCDTGCDLALTGKSIHLPDQQMKLWTKEHLTVLVQIDLVTLFSWSSVSHWPEIHEKRDWCFSYVQIMWFVQFWFCFDYILTINRLTRKKHFSFCQTCPFFFAVKHATT